MRGTGRSLALLLLALSAAAATANGRFDGKWMTTVSCDASRGALGFSYRFIGEVKDGFYEGMHGDKGEPGSLHVTGRIEEDGTAKLYADGYTGSKEYVPGTDTAKGTNFGYHINATFDHHHGTGTRVEGRPCAYEFERQ